MISQLVARGLALGASLLAGFLVLLPLPIVDFLIIVPLQFMIAAGVTILVGKSLKLKRMVPFVLGWALLGGVLGFAADMVPLVGKLAVAPFAALWCYLLAEVSLFRASRT